MEVPTERTRFSVAEYIERESQAMEKHEYREGEVLLMAGNSPEHSLITANIIRELGNHLRGKPCRVYDSNLRIRIPRKVVYTYPDVSVVCGPFESDPDDPSGQSVCNPRLIVEVLSPSTEGYDRGEKFMRYRELASLEEYVLVSQSASRIESFWRQGEGTWLFTVTSGVDSAARLRCLEIELKLGEVYAGVRFPPA